MHAKYDNMDSESPNVTVVNFFILWKLCTVHLLKLHSPIKVNYVILTKLHHVEYGGVHNKRLYKYEPVVPEKWTIEY